MRETSAGLWREWVLPMLILLALPLLPAIAAGLAHPKKPLWSLPPLSEGEVRLADVRGWPADSFLWIDARGEAAFQAGHVEGALPLNESSWDDLVFRSLEQISSGKRLLVYCDSRQCDASKAVRERLMRDGYSQDVHVLHGGWEEIQDDGQIPIGTGGAP